MAVVYKAFDTRLEREVAVKVIRTEKLTIETIPKALKRFDREAKALGKLTHPNIVPISDYGEFDGKPFLVMPLLPGGTLKEVIKLGRMPWQKVVVLLAPIAHALDYAHRQNIVHRDIKPSNILITEVGAPMLSDFGVAKVLSDSDETHELTATGMGVGTPEYMAPEQFLGLADERADIYALGVVMYEMVTGRKPYIADTPAAVIIKQATEPLPRPNRFAPDLPVSIDRILIKALAKTPKDRYQKMGQFGQALESMVVLQEKEKKKQEEKEKKEALQEQKRQKKARKKQEEKKKKEALLQKKREEKARKKEADKKKKVALQEKKHEERQIKKREEQEKQALLQEQKLEEKAQKGELQEIQKTKAPEVIKQKKPRNKTSVRKVAAGLFAIVAISALAWLGFFGKAGETTTESANVNGLTSTIVPNSTVEPRLIFTPTKNSPTPTEIPLFEEGALLFEDDFENGNLGKWTYFGSPVYWSVEEDEFGNFVMQGVGPSDGGESGAPIGDFEWTNYSVSFKLMATQVGSGEGIAFVIFLRSQNEFSPPMYAMNIRPGGGSLHRYTPDWTDTRLGDFRHTFRVDNWYDIRIELFENEISVFVDDVLKIHSTEDAHDYLNYGKVQLLPLSLATDQILWFDDVRVTELVPNEKNQSSLDANQTTEIVPDSETSSGAIFGIMEEATVFIQANNTTYQNSFDRSLGIFEPTPREARIVNQKLVVTTAPRVSDATNLWQSAWNNQMANSSFAVNYKLRRDDVADLSCGFVIGYEKFLGDSASRYQYNFKFFKNYFEFGILSQGDFDTKGKGFFTSDLNNENDITLIVVSDMVGVHVNNELIFTFQNPDGSIDFVNFGLDANARAESGGQCAYDDFSYWNLETFAEQVGELQITNEN